MKKSYWDHAGDTGYLQAMYKSPSVAAYTTQRIWADAINLSHMLGVNNSARVADLGCGDGSFANQMLAQHFVQVEGFELSKQAVDRANASKTHPHISFTSCDITTLDYTSMGRYDAVFMIGILHHVKWAAPSIINAIRNVTDNVIVLEPNGDHLLRKLLEHTPSYKAAGEDSFRKSTLIKLFDDAGFNMAAHHQINLFPNFTPCFIFNRLKWLEPIIENNHLLNGLCTNSLFAFKGR